MIESADATVIASFPSRAAAAIACGALRASGIAAWPEPDEGSGAGCRCVLKVRTPDARAAREVLACRQVEAC